MKNTKIVVAMAALLAIGATAQAQVRITEVAPWSSGNSPVGADWFELTNTGSSAVSISGWKMDDDSASFASAVALNGITSIAAGQSVIFIETSSAVTVDAFKTAWFGSVGAAPADLLIGTYSGSGIGLSANGDAVTIFNAAGAQQAKVAFGASDSTSPYQSFDNGAALDNVSLSTLSVVGTRGAFAAADGVEIGSPGVIAAAVVPEPSSYAMLLGGLLAVGSIVRRRKA